MLKNTFYHGQNIHIVLDLAENALNDYIIHMKTTEDVVKGILKQIL
jgi:hypothetical protein